MYSKDELWRYVHKALWYFQEPEGGDWLLSPVLEIVYLQSVICACDEYELRYGSTLTEERMFLSAVLYFYIQDLGSEPLFFLN